jgi:antitoxin component of RelBE/YafQ-DinJ toxin-antitoxin module
MAISNDTIAIRLPSKIKKDAVRVADELGISLSTVVLTYLKRFIVEKHIVIGDPSDHVSYYKNNPGFVEVNSSAEDVASFLRSHKKK